jgi:HAD superfamily hydrolase (TIGR01493 family)
VEREREQVLRRDPEQEARSWLEKIAAVDRQRAKYQEMAAEELIMKVLVGTEGTVTVELVSRYAPDSGAGSDKMKDLCLLTRMAKRAGLPWDLILSAELVQHHKPNPEIYLMVPHLLGLLPAEVMLVAAHLGDLHAAHTNGLRTAYVTRPRSMAPARNPSQLTWSSTSWRKTSSS